MFRLIRGVISLAVLGGLVYVAVYVPLGEQTLWQHLKAIAGSKESKELVDGVKHKAGEVLDDKAQADKAQADKAQAEKARRAAEAKARARTRAIRRAEKTPPKDGFTTTERAELRKLIRERLARKAARKRQAHAGR